MEKIGSKKIQISLSHTDKYATATAIIEAQSSSN
jgi:phosphopantetheinyl transferase (holo-ACP synthase)